MNEKTPLIRLAKREDMKKSRIWLIRLAAFAVAILIGMIIFAIAGANPIKAYGTMVASSLGKKSGVRQVVKNAIPLLGVGLALAPCFRMRYWNIGGEGQITMGAIFAVLRSASMCALRKLLIPIARTLPASYRSSIALQVSAFASAHLSLIAMGLGQ